jgi:hypothetical protein
VRLFPPAGVVELQVRVDALSTDLAKAIAALNSADPSDAERAALCDLAVYALNKFRNFARQLDAAV